MRSFSEQSYEQYDATQMHEKSTPVEDYMPDDGNGKMQVCWSIYFVFCPWPCVFVCPLSITLVYKITHFLFNLGSPSFHCVS